MNNHTEKNAEANASFTPRPWDWSGTSTSTTTFDIFSEHCGTIAQTQNCLPNRVQLFNARLISCAPEMLAMLEEFLEIIEADLDLILGIYGDNDDTKNRDEYLLLAGKIMDMETLIAKAKGEATND